MRDFLKTYKPQSFDEMLGQDHLCSEKAVFRELCEKGSINHFFLYGPPGCGKTTLAVIVANMLQLPYFALNATSLKIEQIRKIVKEHENTFFKPLMFIDEVHRLSKNQQEVLLPVMEENKALVIGASTQNPFYSLTAAIRSRAMLFEMVAVPNEAILLLLEKVCENEQILIDGEAKEHLVKTSNGDFRTLLNTVQMLASLKRMVTLEDAKSLKPYAYSAGSSEDDAHYDLASALIKSIRGSDADAGIYYLGRLIEGGESADFIARRLVILASEDIGNANPNAAVLCSAIMQSILQIGYPEARILLAQAVIYLCGSPKSNSAYSAINSAQHYIKSGGIHPIPKSIVHDNEGYLYPHDFGGYVQQDYLTKPETFVVLKEVGYEKKMKEWLEELHKSTN